MKLRDYNEGLLKRLKNPSYAAGYLREVLNEESPEAFLIALRDVIEARGTSMTHFSQDAGVTRQALYKTLSKKGNPRLSTIRLVLKSLGLQLSVLEAND